MKKFIGITIAVLFIYTIVRVWVGIKRSALPAWLDEEEYVGI